MQLPHRPHRALTLVELLVVIAIITVALTMSVPTLSKFARGRALESAGRLCQGAMNQARQSAVTARKDHYLIMFRTEADAVGRATYGFRVFRKGEIEGDGYVAEAVAFPNSVVPEVTKVTTRGLYGILQGPPNRGQAEPGFTPGSANSGCRLAVFDQCPVPGAQLNRAANIPDDSGYEWIAPNLFRAYFDHPSMRPKTDSQAFGWLQFRSDGTADLDGGGGRDIPPQRVADESLYDRGVTFAPAKIQVSRILADMTFYQQGEGTKRCYVDIAENIGRSRYRVVLTSEYGRN